MSSAAVLFLSSSQDWRERPCISGIYPAGTVLYGIMDMSTCSMGISACSFWIVLTVARAALQPAAVTGSRGRRLFDRIKDCGFTLSLSPI